MFEEEKKPEIPLAPETEEEIYVMPKHLRKVKKKFVKVEEEKPAPLITKPAVRKKGFPLYLLWIFFGLIIVILGGLFYFKPDLILTLLTPRLEPAPINRPPLPPPPSPPPPQLSAEQTLRAEFRKDEEVIGQIELYLPTGAVPFGSELKLEAFPPAIEPQERYKIINGIFKISPLVSLLKPVRLGIFYPEKEIEKIWEDDLKIGYLYENYWIILPTEVDVENNKLTSQITYFPSQTYAALVSREKMLIQPTEYQEIAPGVLSSPDTDKDALTDQEEIVYRTDKNNPDTDHDSYLDGLEIVNLYSPLSGPGDRLAASDLVRTYTNKTYGYSLFYPTPWLPKVMPESEDREIIISTEIGEFFSLVVQDNPETLSVIDWYKKQVKELKIEQLRKMIVDNQEAVWSLDGLTLYIGKEDKIFAFTYNIGAEKEASFKSTYLMMIKSFKFLALEE